MKSNDLTGNSHNIPNVIKTILVVDDSKLQRRIVRSMLEKRGHCVIEAKSGEEGLVMSALTYPDLVLSDWMMPGMSGLEFCVKFRELGKNRYSYFILLTSKSAKDEVAQGLEMGADDFLTKPLNASELHARIIAAGRILTMQRELEEKNKFISSALEEIKKLYTSLDNDLLEARKLQQSLIRERSKRYGSFELSILLESAGRVGGDLVGFFPAGSSHLGIYSIDVSGHGINSAMMAARLAGYLSSTISDHNIALQQDENGVVGPMQPHDVVANLNNIVLNEMDTELYFTLLLAYLDLSSGALCFVQAGHPHPIIQRADGTFDTIGKGGLPVGLVEKATYDSYRDHLHPGDRILIISDGLTESHDPSGKLLGGEGMKKILSKYRTSKGLDLFDHLLEDLKVYAASKYFNDDVSAVLVEYHA